MEEFKLPMYVGNETEYEDIIYSYIREYTSVNKILFRPKKSRTKIDEYIVGSKSGLKGNGSADGYLIGNTDKDFLIALIELESSGKITSGITQNNAYAKSLLETKAKSELYENQKYFYSIVYDGNLVYFSKWEIETKTETIIFNKSILNNDIAMVIHKELSSLFTIGKNKVVTLEEEQLIKKFKKLIRGKNEVQKYRAELMTILGSIFDITNETEFSKALTSLNKQSSGGTDSLEKKIQDSWTDISSKIVYKNNSTLIEILYEQIAIPMYNLAIDKNIDLYGFFYEELAEKSSKQEDGEYYTPRHIITPLVKKVFNNTFGNYTKEQIKDIVVVDPFCGSGGFLYEYTRMISNKFSLKKEEINKITKSSVYGFDVANLSAAKLNMYLVGDGDVNLTRVKTSIGWNHRYSRERTILKSKSEIKELEMDAKDGLSKFLKLYLPREHFESLKNNGYIDDKELITTIFINKLFEKEIDENGNEVDKLKYGGVIELLENDADLLCLLGTQQSNRGNVNLLLTNVPYGTMEEKESELNKHEIFGSSRLEINSLKDCIDLLKHDSIDPISQEPKGLGGIGLIVVPYGILETDEALTIRQYIAKHTNVKAVIKLPKYTFAPYTQIQTYVLVLQKKSIQEIDSFNSESKNQSKVFMYISDVDGKANSDKRYAVKQQEINKQFGTEYIHDDFAQNFRSYNGDYTSKIEKCWDYQFYKSYGNTYNQKRLLEKWIKKDDGTFGWKEIEGNKWGWFDYSIYQKNISEVKSLPSDVKKQINEYCEIKKISPLQVLDILKNKTIGSFDEQIEFNEIKTKTLKKKFFVKLNSNIKTLEILNSLTYEEKINSFTYEEKGKLKILPKSLTSQMLDYCEIKKISQIKLVDILKTRPIGSLDEEVEFEENKNKIINKQFFNKLNTILISKESLESLFYDDENETFLYSESKVVWDINIMPDSYLRKTKEIDIEDIDTIIASQLKSIGSLLNARN